MAGSTVTAVTFPRDAGRGPVTPKRGLRGATSGVYIGPLLTKATAEGPATPTHAETAAAGGVEDSTGHRESDTYDSTGNTGGFTGGPSSSVSRPTGRTAYIAAGIQGGSTPGAPIDTTGRAITTGTDRFGNTKGILTYTNFDGRATEGRPLGGAGRGTTVDGETVTVHVGRPGTNATAESSGTVAIVNASGKIVTAIHADDIKGGANGLAGALVSYYKRNADTDEDILSLVGAATIGTVATDGADDTDTFTSVASGTYAVYVRWLYDVADGSVAVGPASARATVTVS